MLETRLQCYCGQDKSFDDCCGLYISGKKLAPSALDLMRSRYCAYVLHDMEYIKKTMTENLNEQQSDKIQQFVRLEIISSNPHQVEFKAYYIQNHRLGILHELSDFVLKDNQWFYTSGTLFQTPATNISLNTACPCGSSKKFKNCHYKKY